MKKYFITAFFTVMAAVAARGQTVYSVKYKSEADVKVYVAKYKSEADLVVYKCQYKSEAEGKEKSKKHLMY